MVAGRCDFGAGELAAGPIRPQCRAHVCEGLQGLAQSCCRAVLLASSTLQLTEQQLGAGAFEGHRQPVMFAHGVLGYQTGRVDIAVGGQPHAAAAGADSQHPRTV